MVVEFKLPDLGEGIHEAEVLDIRVKQGDSVKEDQILFEVETDKAAVEVPSPVSGVVQNVLVKVGDIARVGNIMITFIQPGDNASTQKVAASSAGSTTKSTETAGSGIQRPLSGNGKTSTTTTTTATAAVQPVTSNVHGTYSGGPVPAAPATRRLARELGIDLKLINGSGPAGRITKEDVRAFAEGVPSAFAGASQPEVQPQASLLRQTQSVAQRFGGGDAESILTGSLTGQLPAGAAPFVLSDLSKYGQVERVALRSLRRKIAVSMAQSWSHVPRVSNFDEADITDLESLRQKHESTVAKHGGRLTLTAIAIKAVVSALKRFPQFNCSLDEAASEIVFKHFYNIGVAVATDRGLIVPVIHNANQKSLIEISIELADIAQKTREGKIEVERLQGGTFTITNTGPIGGTGSVPMVNFPEVAIMGMARSADKPVVRNGQIVVRNILPLSFSFDHRVGDGAEAALFLRHVATCLEDPFQMLLEV